MEDMFVARVMSSSVQTVPADALVEETAEAMLEKDVGSLVVVDEDGRLEGIITTTDFVRIVANQDPKDQTTVATHMTRDVVTASPQDRVAAVANVMVEEGFHHMPVVTDETGEVVGMITTADLASYVSAVKTPKPA